METKLNHFDKIVSDKGNTRNRSVSLKGVTETTLLHVLENRLFQSRQGCFGYIWTNKFAYAFHSFVHMGRRLQRVN